MLSSPRRVSKLLVTRGVREGGLTSNAAAEKHD